MDRDKTKNERKQERRIKQAWATIFLIGASLMILLVVYGWQTKDVGSNGQIIYSSIEDLNKNFYVTVYMPEDLLNSEGLTYEVYNNQVASIYNSDFVLKATAVLDENADVLGLYGASTTEKFFRNSEAESGEIISVRYRTGYEQYPHCTLLNYCTDTVSYGLMVEETMTVEEAFTLLGISQEEYKIIQDDENIEEETGKVWFSSEMGDKYIRFALPDDEVDTTMGTTFYNDVEYVVTDVMLTLRIQDETILMFVASDSIDGQALPENGVREELDNGLTLVYRTDNPFEEGTQQCEEVQRIQDNIDSLIDSVTFT